MDEFAQFVDRVFLPSLALGLGLSIAWRYIPVGRLRTMLQWTGSLLLFVPQPFALFLGAYSSGLRLYQQALLSLWGFGSFAVLMTRTFSQGAPARPGRLHRAIWWRQTPEEIRRTESLREALRNRPQQPRSRAVRGVAAVAMAAMGVWGGWNTVGDYMLAHRMVTGTVEGARVHHGSRSPSTYEVIIDRHRYNITRDLLARVRPGDVVDAEVGVASGTILTIRSTVPPR
jgi:hypothetical protein